MRMEIDVFFTETPLTDGDALQRYLAHRGGRDPGRPNNPGLGLAAFVSDLTDRYPRLESLPDEERTESPWADDFDIREEQVLIAVGGTHCADAVEFILELAEKHGLVCFDPKTRSILTAPPGLHTEKQSDRAIWPLMHATLSLALVGLLWLH